MKTAPSHPFLRKANAADIPVIWRILQDAIEQRSMDGSTQWQNGYPNENTIAQDIENGVAYVYVQDNEIIAYAAIVFTEDPAYHVIDGQWLTLGKYVNLHRIATAKTAKNRGIATKLLTDIETFCVTKGIPSIKIDTNFDNRPMLRVLEKLGYSYCGEVLVDGSPRNAFEKILSHQK